MRILSYNMIDYLSSISSLIALYIFIAIVIALIVVYVRRKK